MPPFVFANGGARATVTRGWRRSVQFFDCDCRPRWLFSCSRAGGAPPEPLVHVKPATWRAIDEQILDASVCARHESEAYARVAMDDWRLRVRQRTEDVFIPWYSSYWTQQWMATRVGWYKLQYTEGK